MWVLLKGLLLKFALLKTVLQMLKGLGSLAIFIPIAMLLSTFGWPVLMVLAVLALPILLLLFLFGLPILLVVGAGGVMMTIIGFVLTAAMPILKIFIGIILPLAAVFFVTRWIWRLVFGDDDSKNGGSPTVPPKPATGEA